MARFGTVVSGSFAGAVTPAIWTEVMDVLIPKMLTYGGGGSVRVAPNAGKWEGHIVSEVHDHLRIDMQGLTEPRNTAGVTWQAGSAARGDDATPIRYANWQIQFGPHGANRIAFAAQRSLTGAQLQSHKGSIAGIHMALANDFTIAEIQRAFQLSYTGCAATGNVFGLLLPTGAYTEPVIEIQKRWIVDLRCKRACKSQNRRAFKINFAKKEGRFPDKISVDTFLANAMGQVPCPVCAAKYALEVEGTNDEAIGGRQNWAYNFDIDSYTLNARG